jgi:hypothetical protein
MMGSLDLRNSIVHDAGGWGTFDTYVTVVSGCSLASEKVWGTPHRTIFFLGSRVHRVLGMQAGPLSGCMSFPEEPRRMGVILPWH